MNLMDDKENLNEKEKIELRKYIRFSKKYYTRKYYNLFIKKEIYIPNENNGDDYFCLGKYYDSIEDNINLAKDFHLIAISLGNSDSMFYIGLYYYCEGNYEQMEKYYLMAIEKYNTTAMVYFGFYYSTIKNYNLMKKYYLQAIIFGKSSAMHNLAVYYRDIEQNYEQMKIYFLLAIGKGRSESMTYLGNYYKDIEKNYDLAKKYYLMAIKKGNISSMINLGNYYYDLEKYNLAIEYYLLISNYNINKFFEIVNYNLTKKMFVKRLMINSICKLFMGDKSFCLLETLKPEMIKIYIKCIFDYLNYENNCEKIPENINIFFVYIGKIFHKCKKYLNSQSQLKKTK
jgi:TPR repeat protein